ncbi:hypothetical protein [Kribbella sp. NPDC051718]|uniref:hypothetical protein n=1 Tax=Kribbella sp. NPDC051718 TaxID=3155168 RepID=UPI00342EB1BF
MDANETNTAVQLVQALVWPALILVALVVYRKPLRAFAKRLTHVRVGGQEFIANTVRSSDILLRSLPLTASHPEAVPKDFETEIMQLASTDPRAALIRLRKETDRRVRLISLVGNWLNDYESRTERWLQMNWLAGQLSWEPDVRASVMVHAIIEDAALKEPDGISEQLLLGLVDQSLTVLGLVRSHKFERHIVIASDLEIFSDQSLTQIVPDRRAVLLNSISIEGIENTRALLTSRPRYYKSGMQVGWEWRADPPFEECQGFVADPSGGPAITLIGWDFRGRDLADFY